MIIAVVVILGIRSMISESFLDEKVKDITKKEIETSTENSTTTNSTSTNSATTTAVKKEINNKTENKKTMQITIKTNMGDIGIMLDRERSPKTVDNFLKLVESGFYDGVRFHRVIKGFMIQSGDPLSKDLSKKSVWGTGGPGYKFDDEIKGGETYKRGTLAMANSGPNTNGSQFFIVTAEDSHLPASYTVFGNVVSGIDTALKIQESKTDSSDKPLVDVIVTGVTVNK